MGNLKSVLLVVLLILMSAFAFAKINFQAANDDKIDMKTLDIDKSRFFDYVNKTILNREPGLGNYGRVAFYPCEMDYNGMKIIDHKTMDDKEVKYLSNPSCDQIVIRKVLQKNYQYDVNAISSYQDRQCILSVEKIISPMLEYYTIKYEEKNNANCRACDFKEKERLDLIMGTQKKIKERCHTQSPKVMNFISELDIQIESSYKTKTGR